MLVTCNTNELNKLLQTAQHAIISKPSTPIFSGFHLEAKENRLEVQGMDLNMAISCTMEAQVDAPGEIVVAAKQLGDLIRKLSGSTVTLEKRDGSVLRVTSGQSEFRLLLMNEEDYPKFPEFSGDKNIVIEDEKIRELIKKTIFACAADDARPLFTGILVEIENEKITFVGTNTHRLAIRSLPLPGAESMSVIIPAKVLTEISRVLGGDVPQTVQIGLLNNQVVVAIDEIRIVSRLIEGRFPNYKAVIPPSFAVTASVNIRELAGAVERVALFSNENDYSIIKVNVKDGQITITSSSPELGAGREVIEAETEGAELNVAFNAKYILDILKNLDSEEAVLSFNSSLKPVCVKAPGQDDYTYIVTPVRVVF